jgi:hypothetical protein
MFFNVLACAELYQVITGGEVFIVQDSQWLQNHDHIFA